MKDSTRERRSKIPLQEIKKANYATREDILKFGETTKKDIRNLNEMMIIWMKNTEERYSRYDEKLISLLEAIKDQKLEKKPRIEKNGGKGPRALTSLSPSLSSSLSPSLSSSLSPSLCTDDVCSLFSYYVGDCFCISESTIDSSLPVKTVDSSCFAQKDISVVSSFSLSLPSSPEKTSPPVSSYYSSPPPKSAFSSSLKVYVSPVVKNVSSQFLNFPPSTSLSVTINSSNYSEEKEEEHLPTDDMNYKDMNYNEVINFPSIPAANQLMKHKNLPSLPTSERDEINLTGWAEWGKLALNSFSTLSLINGMVLVVAEFCELHPGILWV